ncbi:MAG: T9SS type A sorting domain-containing protein [Bacteroidia bacterium]|nr:T9SS type A sorting domain-containing protein [Bacteroidia bacterium]
MSNKPQLDQSGKLSPLSVLVTLGTGLFLTILLIFVYNRNDIAIADCNISYPGDAGNISLTIGDSVCIPIGSVFTGTVSSFPTGSKITVQSGAVFKPSSMSTAAGLMINEGEAILPNLVLGSGFRLNNVDTLSFDGTLSLSGSVNIENMEDGRITFVYPLLFDQSSTLENKGILYSGSDVEFAASSIFTNNGYFVGLGSFEFNSALENYGLVSSVGSISLGGTSSMNNYCSLLSATGFVNDNPNSQNAGIILVQGAGGAPNDLIEINQAFNNQASGYVAGVRFTNNSTITGSGNFYFSGETINNGSFGDDAVGINFYDDSSPSNIMDIENTTPDASVSRDAGSIPDSFYIPPTCDVAFLPAFLPVEWQDISVSYENGAGVIQWSTSQEINHDHYEVERSLDGKSFGFVAEVNNPSNTNGNLKSYSYTDFAIQLNENRSIYYRIKQVDIDGKSSLSQVLQLSTEIQELPLSFSVANPVIGQNLSLNISSNETGQGEISLLDSQGKMVYKNSISINRGRNSRVISLNTLPSGMYVVELKANGKKLSKKVILHAL